MQHRVGIVGSTRRGHAGRSRRGTILRLSLPEMVATPAIKEVLRVRGFGAFAILVLQSGRRPCRGRY